MRKLLIILLLLPLFCQAQKKVSSYDSIGVNRHTYFFIYNSDSNYEYLAPFDSLMNAFGGRSLDTAAVVSIVSDTAESVRLAITTLQQQIFNIEYVTHISAAGTDTVGGYYFPLVTTFVRAQAILVIHSVTGSPTSTVSIGYKNGFGTSTGTALAPMGATSTTIPATPGTYYFPPILLPLNPVFPVSVYDQVSTGTISYDLWVYWEYAQE